MSAVCGGARRVAFKFLNVIDEHLRELSLLGPL